jgi:hypothetical protein
MPRKTYKTHKLPPIFNDINYKSNNGFMTSVWGPCLWFFIHLTSFNYPVNPTPENKKHYRDFILSLENILPCGKCRKNLSINLKKLPLTDADMENRDTFSRYIFNLHETVNTMLKKKSGLKYEDVRDRFENFRAQCKKTQKKRSHKGCTEPTKGHIKSKCVIQIVPKTKKCNTLNISKKCIPKPTK